MQAEDPEAKLRASTKALEEACAQISGAEAKHKKEVKAVVKAAKKVVTKAKAQTAKAEDALSKKEIEQAPREEGVRLCLDKLSNSLGSKSFQIFG
jgi:hypothetical protein